MSIPTMHSVEWRVLLSEWEPIWQQAGLPYIPMEQIGSATVAEWFRLLDGEESPNAAHALEQAGVLPPGYMARWDCCAGFDLKQAMGVNGSASTNARQPWTVDDPRLVDIMFDVAACHETGMDTPVAMYKRPWVEPEMVGGWPLEFRVYASGGEIMGVSSYYPQRDLPEEYLWHAKTCVGMTDHLFAADARDFSADWLFPAGTTGPILVECGPPKTPGGGAHPCCFEGRGIIGVALRLEGEQG